GVDVEQVRKGIGADQRIGYSFIYPGAGYGGSCFPKDVRALISMAKEANIESGLFSAVEARNQYQKLSIVRKVQRHYGADLNGKTFALWGLAFKPETDDVREAPALVVIKELLTAGATIKAYDPQATETSKAALFDIDLTNLHYQMNPEATLQDADALIIMTEWKVFRQPDFKKLASVLKDKIIFDGRNMYEPELISKYGLQYRGIGRTNE
ncbi:MAG: UDP-glucose/GDP-mannose dehydrogenase family protein, partial [Pseudomonadales bacterium]|nr:UDP-glucose/GDP-mannose dehydrogenase family protein [Pseudomonadales bacterium]